MVEYLRDLVSKSKAGDKYGKIRSLLIYLDLLFYLVLCTEEFFCRNLCPSVC